MSADWQTHSWGELLAALRRDLQLDPSTDVLGGVLQTLASAGARVATGLVTVTWGGVNAFTDQPTVTHGLPSKPSLVIVSGNWDYVDFAVGAFNVTATTFQVQGNRFAASVPAAGTDTVYWLALV